MAAMMRVRRALVITAAAVVGFRVLNNHFYSVSRTSGRSMLPTIVPGSVVLYEVEGSFPLLSRPLRLERGDLVAFHSPVAEGRRNIKRLVGLEGDEITVQQRSTGVRSVVRVPPGHMWVEGDNPSESVDSRMFGPVSCSLLIGRCFFTVLPMRSFGRLQ